MPVHASTKSSTTNWAFLVMWMGSGGGAGFTVQGTTNFSHNYSQAWVMTGQYTGYWAYTTTSQYVNSCIKSYKNFPFTHNITGSSIKYYKNNTLNTTYYLSTYNPGPVLTEPTSKWYYFKEAVNRYFNSKSSNKFVPGLLWYSSATTPNQKGVSCNSITLP